jgi:1-phosphofructokinase family hexose kinase
MLLTFTPNPCIERTLSLPELIRGESHRVDTEAVFVNAGGKGINAARVAARFGCQVMAIGAVGQHQSEFLRSLMQCEGINHDFIEIEADTRVCINVVHGDGDKTEIIENGTSINVHDGTRLLEKWRHWLPQTRLATIGGSYPPSTNDASNWHATILCDMAASAGVPVIYDGKGEPFARALASKSPPWAIKPNLEEARAYLKRPLETPADEQKAVRDFLRKGVEVVLLSCGSRGLYVGHRGGVEWFEAPQVKTVSAVGSGDSLVGAFAAKWLETGDIFEAARWGVAAGSANAAQQRPAFVTPEDVLPLLPQIKRATREIALQILA